ncbi:MAG: bis-aminopropyl spermidine synthase family protein [Defluviitaleaceae bacterium]|nr:bis-aminopropyl spermidine synthase family protein [Defluviitaleaceae bacterium]
MNAAFEEVYAGCRLLEGVGTLEAFLVNSYLRPGISAGEMAGRLQIPVPVCSAIKNECKKRGLLEIFGTGVNLTKAAEDIVRGDFGYADVDASKLLAALDKTELPLEMFSEALAGIESAYASRPQADVTLDQSLCTAETGLRRALLMLRTGGLIGKKILFIGDDDMTSVAVSFALRGLLAKTAGMNKIPAEITVMDLDERVLSNISDVSLREGFGIETVSYDAKLPLNSLREGAYDAVATDPPYTLPGLSLFLSRAACALKKGPGYFAYLSFAKKEPAARLAAQRVIIGAGFVMTQLLSRFNEYHGASILGGASDMIVLSSTDETKPVCSYSSEMKLYTNEQNRSVRTYQCKSCRAKLAVGHGNAHSNVEALKKAGCPNCGSKVFLLKERTLI